MLYRSTTLFALFASIASLSLSAAAPTSEDGRAPSRIGDAAERRMWTRQLATSVNEISWSLVEGGGGATSSTATSLPTTSGETLATTSTATTEPQSSTPSSGSTSGLASSASSSVTTSTSSPSSRSATNANTRSTASSPEMISAAARASTVLDQREQARSNGNIFTPSNKLFAVGIIVIIAIVVLAIFIFIFIVKRVLHSSRFIDPLDYPEGLPPKYPHDYQSRSVVDPAQLSPSAKSFESYDSLEKGRLDGDGVEQKPCDYDETRHEFAVPRLLRHDPSGTGGGGGRAVAGVVVSPPPSAALPPLPRPPPSSIAATTNQRQRPGLPFSNLEPVLAPRPPPTSSSSSSSFSAPAFDGATRRPATTALPKPLPRAEKRLPRTTTTQTLAVTSSSSAAALRHDQRPSGDGQRRDRPSYVSTLPLSPDSRSRPFKTTTTQPAPPPPTKATTTTTTTTSTPRGNLDRPKPKPKPSPASSASAPRHDYSPPKGRESPLRETAFKREGTTTLRKNGPLPRR